MNSLMNTMTSTGAAWSGGGSPPPKRGRFDAGQSASGGDWAQATGTYDQEAATQDYGVGENYSSYGVYEEQGWNQPAPTGSGYGGPPGVYARGRARGAATALQQSSDALAHEAAPAAYGNASTGEGYYDYSDTTQASYYQQNPSRGRGRGLRPQAPQEELTYYQYQYGGDGSYNEQSDSGYQSGVAQKRKYNDPPFQQGNNYDPMSLVGTLRSYESGGGSGGGGGGGLRSTRGGSAQGWGHGGWYDESGYGDGGGDGNEDQYYDYWQQTPKQDAYNTGYRPRGRGMAGSARGDPSRFRGRYSYNEGSIGGPRGGMRRGRARGGPSFDHRRGGMSDDGYGYDMYSGSGGPGRFPGRGRRGGSFGGEPVASLFDNNNWGRGNRRRPFIGGPRARGGGRGLPRGRGRGQATPLMGGVGARGARWAHVGFAPRPGAPGNSLSLEQRFKNLCMLVKKSPHTALASSLSLESFLADENVCLAPAYVFKGERREESLPFSFNCKVYINNVYIASGLATNKKDSKNRACVTALGVLAEKPALTILDEHEKVDVSALGKQDADIVECALKSSESNIGNVLAKASSGDQKTAADFYILEPEQVDEATGMNSTCILRQSADFSHLLLKYEFSTSSKGFACMVNIEGKMCARATAAQQNLAKNAASHIALQNLRRNNWTIQIIKQSKPKPGAEQLTDKLGRVNSTTDRPEFIGKLKDYLKGYFEALDDHTQWLALSPELNRDERDCVYSVSKELELRVETKRVDGGRGPVGDSDNVFLVVSKKMSCQDLFDYIWEKGGETWRYKLRPPSQFKVPGTQVKDPENKAEDTAHGETEDAGETEDTGETEDDGEAEDAGEADDAGEAEDAEEAEDMAEGEDNGEEEQVEVKEEPSD